MATRRNELETKFTGDATQFNRVANSVVRQGRRVGTAFSSVVGGFAGGVTSFLLSTSIQRIESSAEDAISAFDRLEKAIEPFAVGLDFVINKVFDLADALAENFGFTGLFDEDHARTKSGKDPKVRPFENLPSWREQQFRSLQVGASIGGASALLSRSTGQRTFEKLMERQIGEVKRMREEMEEFNETLKAGLVDPL